MTFAPTPERPAGCASDLELDELLSGDLAGQPKERALRAHLDGCSRCRARLAAFSAIEPPAFTTMAPANGSAAAPTAQPMARAPRRRWAVLGIGSAAAVAAVIAFVALTPTTGERTKGELALTVFIKRAGGAVDTINQEGDMHAGDEMRFALSSGAPGHAVVLGLDEVPSVTVYAPSPPATSAIPIDAAGTITLPGSIVADATPGTERVVALVCAAPTAPEALRARAQAALTAASGRPEEVGRLGSGCAEATVLLHKVPSRP